MKNIVKEGYEKVAGVYDAERNQFSNNKYLEVFNEHVKKGGTVLDVGCGSGRPVAKFLVEKGVAVNGIDVSEKMIELAKRNVPQGFFEVKDMLDLKDGEYCVDGIVSFYAIFHTPREKHQELLKKFVSFLPNGGVILISMGASDWEGTEEDFHGTKMSWSHYGSEKNRQLVESAGFKVLLDKIDDSGGEKHQVILAKI